MLLLVITKEMRSVRKGVTLIIRKQLEKHIFDIEKYKGRILKVDLSFKGNKQL